MSFTVGATAKAAVKAAVMCEEVARTVHIARQLGEPLALDQADIDSLYARYQSAYGQPGSFDKLRTPPSTGSGSR